MNYNDLNRPITAEDLIRRYDLNSLKTTKRIVNQINNTIQKQYILIKQYVKNVSYYKGETDCITVFFYNGTPTTQNDPFKSFTDDEKISKIGSLYYDRETGNVYQLEYENSIYSWVLIEDDELTQSLALANSDADTEDNKRNLFLSTPTTPYETGDIWLNDNVIMRCRCSRAGGTYSSTDWVTEEEYTDSCVILDVRAVLNEFKSDVKANYATTASLETTKESINANVTALTLLAGAMNNVYKSQPIPPYNKGDLYVVGTSVYYCKQSRTTGNYTASDWQLTSDATYSTSTGDINVTAGDITSTVSLKVGAKEIISRINQTPEQITINANKIGLTANDIINIIAGNTLNLTAKNIAIDSTNFKVNTSGNITATGGTIGGWTLSSTTISQTHGNYTVTLANYNNENASSRILHCTFDDGTNSYDTLYINRSGKLYCSNAEIYGTVKVTGSLSAGNNDSYSTPAFYVTSSGVTKISNCQYINFGELNRWIRWGYESDPTSDFNIGVLNSNDNYTMHLNCNPVGNQTARIIFNANETKIEFQNNVEDLKTYFRPVSGYDDQIYLGSGGRRWATIYSSNGTINTSDRNQKHDIEDIDETIEKIFLETPTKTYYFNNGDRRHIGTIAQDVEELLTKYGLTALDFAPFCKDLKTKDILDENGDVAETVPDLDENGNEQYTYGFRYSEYIMLNTHMIQKLFSEFKLLKERLEELENGQTISN